MNSKIITFSGYLFLLIFAIWHYFFCNTETITIKTDPIIMEFPVIVPTERIVKVTEVKEIERIKKEYNFSQSEIDKILSEIEKPEPLKLRELDERLEDDYIVINAKGLVLGEVKRLKIDYEIKPQTIEVEIKKQKLSLFVGGQVGANKELDQFTYKIDADLLTKNKIYKASYQKINNESFGLIGLSLKVF